MLSTFTFDLASGRLLALADLFRPGGSYMDALATEARAQLKVTLADRVADTSMTAWLATGTEPTADNYAAWAILTEAQVTALVGHLASLPVTSGVPPQGGLGYHGFSIVLHEAGLADRTVVAYRGAVTSPGDAPGSYRADPQRTVEQALLDRGRPHLAATEISVVEADLTGP